MARTTTPSTNGTAHGLTNRLSDLLNAPAPAVETPAKPKPRARKKARKDIARRKAARALSLWWAERVAVLEVLYAELYDVREFARVCPRVRQMFSHGDLNGLVGDLGQLAGDMSCWSPRLSVAGPPAGTVGRILKRLK